MTLMTILERMHTDTSFWHLIGPITTTWLRVQEAQMSSALWAGKNFTFFTTNIKRNSTLTSTYHSLITHSQSMLCALLVVLLW